jgi:hypothetical protein
MALFIEERYGTEQIRSFYIFFVTRVNLSLATTFTILDSNIII